MTLRTTLHRTLAVALITSTFGVELSRVTLTDNVKGEEVMAGMGRTGRWLAFEHGDGIGRGDAEVDVRFGKAGPDRQRTEIARHSVIELAEDDSSVLVARRS